MSFAEGTNASAPQKDQLMALVDGAVLPMVKTYSSQTNTSGNFDVIVIDDQDTCLQLRDKYSRWSNWMKFETADSVIVKDGVYVHKATNHRVYVNRFVLLGRSEHKCEVQWTRVIASLGGFSKRITLIWKHNAWKVADVKLISVS